MLRCCSMELTWRDMQHLVVETARIPNPEEGGWLLNGAGYHVNHRFASARTLLKFIRHLTN